MVNYVWISELPAQDSETRENMCTVPLQHVHRAIENANRYPDADFILWLDNRLLDDLSRFWVASYIYQCSDHRNVILCDLNAIPAYSGEDLFKNTDHKGKNRSGAGSVYVRADCARILVLDHCLKQNRDRPFILYSDIDCPDLKLAEAGRVVQQHGVAINSLGRFFWITSHGYIALSPSRRDVGMLFPLLCDETIKAAQKGDLGDRAFSRFLNRLGHYAIINRRGIQLRALPPMRQNIEALPYLQLLGIS
ncbi:MAG: hypothetical protein KDJ49_03065 [Alphaproteobacteria bacterium]|nr:hypothetical protein [Alphaproteobacteria bacterium]